MTISLSPHPAVDNPVLTPRDVTDVESAQLVADPFIVRFDGQYYLFFEVGAETNVIAYATSEDGISWEYESVVLEVDTHLSFPQVLRHNDEWFMIPSLSPSTAEVRLYRAADFPKRWEHVATPLTGKPVVDPAITRSGEFFWMLCADTQFDWLSTNPIDVVRRRPHAYSINLYYSKDLVTDDWTPADGNPVLRDRRTQRPAGPIYRTDSETFTHFQEWNDDGPVAVRRYRVTDFSTDGYTHEESEASPIVSGTGGGEWNTRAMHHVDASLAETDGLAVVDGKGPDGNWRIGIYAPTYSGSRQT